MLKITKSGLKLNNLPYTLNEPFHAILFVRDTYKGKLDVQVKYYDKTDLEYEYPLAVSVLVNGQAMYQEFEYDRQTDGVDTLQFAHDKMKAFLLTVKVDPNNPESENVFTDSEIEIVDL